MKLLIFGASGATGVLLVKRALTGGHNVTAFVREPQKLNLDHANLTVMMGNVGDLNTVQQAVKGQDVVLSALGAERVFKFDPVVVNGLKNIVSAMTTEQVKRLIYLSTLGVPTTRRAAGFMIRLLAPTILAHEIKGHELREKIIYTSQLEWTIVRAPILTNGIFTGMYRTKEHLVSTQLVNRLSREDVAHCMLAQLTDSKVTRKAISVMSQSKQIKNL